MSDAKSAGEFVFPGPPGNRESPVNRCGPSAARYTRAIEPGVCPRRWMTSSGTRPTVIVSPCSTVSSAGTGNSGASRGCASCRVPNFSATAPRACQWS